MRSLSRCFLRLMLRLSHKQFPRISLADGFSLA